MPADTLPRLLDALRQESAAGLLACTPENVSYLIDAALPFARQYPDRPVLAFLSPAGERLLALPFDWAEAVTDQGYTGEILAYDENAGRQPRAAVQVMARALAERGLADKALLADPEDAPAAYAAALAEALPGAALRPGADWLAERRLVKTPAEIERIEQASIMADRGFIGAINHLEGTTGIVQYTLEEVAERVRVHAIEYNISTVGHLAALQGASGAELYRPATGLVRPGELLRLECSAAYLGCWASAARMLSIGAPTPEQAAAFRANLQLKQAALGALRVGAPAGGAFSAAAEAARQQGVDFCGEAGVGHGVGRSEFEAPFLTEGNPMPLQAGMVVALDVVTRAPSGELIRSIDTYALEEGGPRLLSWYKRWEKLYAITGWRSTH